MKISSASTITDTVGAVVGRSVVFGTYGENAIFGDIGRRVTLSEHPPISQKYDISILRQSQEDSRRLAFEQSSNNWIAGTAIFSSISTIMKHPEAAQILEMGQDAIKFILEKLENGDVHVHWFPILKGLSHEDPVPPEKRGLVPQMAEEWMEWGRSKGYLQRNAA